MCASASLSLSEQKLELPLLLCIEIAMCVGKEWQLHTRLLLLILFSYDLGFLFQNTFDRICRLYTLLLKLFLHSREN